MASKKLSDAEINPVMKNNHYAIAKEVFTLFDSLFEFSILGGGMTCYLLEDA